MNKQELAGIGLANMILELIAEFDDDIQMAIAASVLLSVCKRTDMDIDKTSEILKKTYKMKDIRKECLQ